MAGFCSYSEDWWEAYDPVFDGYAAEVGLRSGDVVRGLQVGVTQHLALITT